MLSPIKNCLISVHGMHRKGVYYTIVIYTEKIFNLLTSFQIWLKYVYMLRNLQFRFMELVLVWKYQTLKSRYSRHCILAETALR